MVSPEEQGLAEKQMSPAVSSGEVAGWPTQRKGPCPAHTRRGCRGNARSSRAGAKEKQEHGPPLTST